MPEPITTEPYPLDVTPAEALRWIVKSCARAARSKRSGRPRWSIVASVTGNGSGYSFALCRWAGVDPEERCVRA